MNDEPLAILLIEDSDADAALIERAVRCDGRQAAFVRVSLAEEFPDAFASRDWDIVLSDYSMPGYDAFTALERVVAEQPGTPFVVVSGTIGEERAIELMRRGVADYCLKEHLNRLSTVVDRAVNEAREHRALREAELRLVLAAKEWQATFDAISDLVFVAAPLGEVTRLNRAAAALLGGDPDATIGAQILDVLCMLAGEDKRRVVERCRREDATQFELGSCGPPERWYDVRIDQLLSDDGSAQGWVFVISDITARKRSESDLRELVRQLERSMRGSVSIAAHMVEKRDPYTAGHQEGVAEVAVEISERLGMSEAQIDLVRTASLLHDIGKIAVPAEILVKPGTLDPYEWLIMQRHPEVGAEVLEDAELGGPIAQIIRQHHERLDGSGYPCGLEADEICVEARIIAVADVTEAMLAHRPYRPARTLAETSDELKSGRGTKYDERAVDACLAMLESRV